MSDLFFMFVGVGFFAAVVLHAFASGRSPGKTKSRLLTTHAIENSFRANASRTDISEQRLIDRGQDTSVYSAYGRGLVASVAGEPGQYLRRFVWDSYRVPFVAHRGSTFASRDVAWEHRRPSSAVQEIIHG